MQAIFDRMRSERGFTLLELMIVAVVIGVLAAIALPVFLSQQDRGKDASAKSDARNMATAVESCRHGEPSYAACDEPAELASEASGFSWGTGPGQVRVASATSTSFTVEAVSNGRTDGAHNRFTLERGSAGEVTRTCTGSGGCSNGSW